MNMRYLAAFLAFSSLYAAAPCDSLAKLMLPHAAITLAEAVPAGKLTLPPGAIPRFPGFPPPSFGGLPAICRVAATLKPTADSDIKIEVWLPESGWNRKLESVGNGAWAGNISYRDLATAVTAGYAAASTDTGHTDTTAAFVMGHPEKLIDFAYRAVHEMTVVAKAITGEYYGNAPVRASLMAALRAGARRWRKRSDSRAITTALSPAPLPIIRPICRARRCGWRKSHTRTTAIFLPRSIH